MNLGAVMALVVVIGDSNSVPWIVNENLGYVARLESQISAPVEKISMPSTGFLQGGREKARSAVRKAQRMGARKVVLELGTADVAFSSATAAQIARIAVRRYHQADKFADRVLLIEPLAVVDGDGPLATAVRAKKAAIVALLGADIPAADLIDTSWVTSAHLVDQLHLNSDGHALLATKILAKLQ